MFDFTNLNDYEFEVLSKDILERITKQYLRIFTPGKDDGIDISNFSDCNLLIAQVKRYTTNFDKLYSSLKKLKKQIEQIKPKTFYITTSLGLTPQNISKIYELFQDYIESPKNILAKDDLNQFLEKEENKDIVKKNFKLWLSAANVISIFAEKNLDIDSKIYVDDVIKKQKIYVETNDYYLSLKYLEKKKSLLIIGDPGVGKSTVSNMIALYYFNKGFEIIFSSNRNIDSLKRKLSDIDDKKQLFILDDFLGQICLDVKEENVKEIYTLVSTIVSRKNKYIILNSRIVILNKVENKYDISYNSLSNLLSKCIIDLNKMNLLEKAKILYNHLYFSNLDEKYFEEIKKDERYFIILNHKNYNPRIIEYVCDNNRLIRNNISSNNYFEYIINLLNNPKEIWKNEIENNISNTDRIFLQTLYSISNNEVEYSMLKEAVEHRFENTIGIDHSLPNFEDSVKTLSNSCIKITEQNKKRMISVINPSVNDYLKNIIDCNKEIKNSIIKNATSIDQYIKLIPNFENSAEFKFLIDSNELFKLDSKDIAPPYLFLKYIFQNKILDKKYSNKVLESLSQKKYRNNCLLNMPSDYIDILFFFFNTDAYIFYDIKKILRVEVLENIFERLYLDELVQFVNEILASKINDIDNNNNILSILNLIEEKTKIKICDICIDNINDMSNSIISEAVDNMPDQFDNDDLVDEVYSSVDDIIKAMVEEYIPKYNIKNVKIEFITNDFDYIKYNLDINEESILKYFNNEEMDYENYFVDNDTENYIPAIKNMFNR